jgi:hypothetical protein
MHIFIYRVKYKQIDNEDQFYINYIKYEKPCFSNYMISGKCKNHYGCELQGKCFEQTSIRKGVCDCKLKSYCALSRQELQDKFRKEEQRNGIQDCEFYQMMRK